MRLALASYPEYGLIQFVPRRRRPFPWRTRLRLCARYSWRFLRTGDEDYIDAAELALRGRQVALIGWAMARANRRVGLVLAGVLAGVTAPMPALRQFYDTVAEAQRADVIRQAEEALRS